MTRLLVFGFLLLTIGWCSEEVFNENTEESFNSTQIKINGKTHFFQLRKDNNGNVTYYKTVKDYHSNPNDDIVEFIVQRRNKNSEIGLFENWKNQRKEYLKHERSLLNHNIHFLDDEWKYNLNNPFIEIPYFAHQLYRSILEKSNKPQNISTIRLLFEMATNEDEIIKFDLNTLRNKSNEIIIDAELHVYRLSENNDTANGSRSATDLVIRLYQLLPTNGTTEVYKQNPDVHKLLSVIYVSSQYSGWQIFKVKNVLENWLNGEENFGFLLSATDSWENTVPISFAHRHDGKYQPVLVVSFYSKNHKEINTSPTTSDAKQLKRYINWFKYTNALPTDPLPCSRHVWYISFQDLGWDNFIISPSGFMAFRCKGSCISPFSHHFTNHGKLISMYYDNISHQERPCCVPNSYKTLPIMFYDKHQNIVIKSYNDLIVESCACR